MARVTVHLNGKRRGTTTPAIKRIPGQSRLAREAIAHAAHLQHVQAQSPIDAASANFDTHWGSMQRTYHPEDDTPDAHEARALVKPHGKVEAIDHKVSSDTSIKWMLRTREHAASAQAERRANLRALSARRNDVAALRLDPE